MDTVTQLFTAVVTNVLGKENAETSARIANATAAAAAAAARAKLPDENDYVTTAMALDDNEGNGNNEDDPYATGGSDSGPGHPDGQVSEAESPTLVSPLVEDISVVQTLISPSISSDNASVSIDITIDGNAEEYEVYWVTV